ncbi:MAG: 2-phosphosulfolactate phosphatase [Candidatus Cyclobacteriaceae bacterium M3_2C_046]
MEKPVLEVCISPQLTGLFDLSGKLVVMVDVLRASSCMVTGLSHGIARFKPVITPEECYNYRQKDFLLAGERGGEKLPGFDLGNSPFEYMKIDWRGRAVAMTTTNGTRALQEASKAARILIGSFLNFSSLKSYLLNQPTDLVVLCAGWEGHLSLEDFLFAGLLAEKLTDAYQLGDAAFLAQKFFQSCSTDFVSFLAQSNHVLRLKKLGFEKDIDFCLTLDQFQVIPEMKNGFIVTLK